MDSRSMADALVQVAQEVKLMRGQLEGFVRHEGQAEKLNEHRRELMTLVGQIETRILRLIEDERRQTRAERSQEITASESKMQREMDARITGVERRTAEREARDEHMEARMQRQMMWLAGVAVSGIAFALYELFARGVG